MLLILKDGGAFDSHTLPPIFKHLIGVACCLRAVQRQSHNSALRLLHFVDTSASAERQLLPQEQNLCAHGCARTHRSQDKARSIQPRFRDEVHRTAQEGAGSCPRIRHNKSGSHGCSFIENQSFFTAAILPKIVPRGQNLGIFHLDGFFAEHSTKVPSIRFA